MTKVGKALNKVTDTVIKASGEATKFTGETMADACKAMGMDSQKCKRIESKADRMGKDMYYYGSKVAKKVEKATDDVLQNSKELLENSKEALESVVDKFK